MNLYIVSTLMTLTILVFSILPLKSAQEQSNSIAAQTSITTPDKSESTDIIQSAFETACEKIINYKDQYEITIEDRLLRQKVFEFSLFPEELNIPDFPTAIASTETDPESLAEYYLAIGQAYLNQAEKAYDESVTDSRIRLAKAKQTQGMENFRTQDLRLEDNRTPTPNNKFDAIAGHETPSKTRIQPSISQRALIQKEKSYNAQREIAEGLALKGVFYNTMALAFLPEVIDEIDNKETTQNKDQS